LSLLRIDKSLTFPNFLPMAFSHISFRIAIEPIVVEKLKQQAILRGRSLKAVIFLKVFKVDYTTFLS
jgi:hypothetical protein